MLCQHFLIDDFLIDFRVIVHGLIISRSSYLRCDHFVTHKIATRKQFQLNVKIMLRFSIEKKNSLHLLPKKPHAQPSNKNYYSVG
jgi:hypothetical protein